MLKSMIIRPSKALSSPASTQILFRSAGSLQPYDIPYGKPSRMSNSGMTATVFGSYGFLGRYLTSNLGSIGTRVYAPFRGCELEVRILKPMFDHGQLGLMPFSARDDTCIEQSIRHSDLVVNFIGKHFETKHLVPTRRADGQLSRVNYDFDEVHVDIPRKLARMARQAGVQTFIHVSALSADVDSSSKWSRTKALGELAVREEFPEAIIIRPATVYGAEDRFLNVIAENIELYKYFPLVNDGKNLVQPVYVDDVATAIMKIIYDWRQYEGKTFQLAGPAEYTYKEVVEFVSDITTLPTHMISLPSPIAMGAAAITEQLINPVITRDQLHQMMEDNILLDDAGDMLTFESLGIVPTPMDRVAFDFLHRFRPGGHFKKVSGYHSDLKI